MYAIKKNLGGISLAIVLIIIVCLSTLYFSEKKDIKKEIKKNKIAVLLHGFSPRSFKYTYKNISNRVIKILEEDYVVDVYHHTLLTKSGKIESREKGIEDEMNVNNEDYKLLKTNVTEKTYQEDMYNPFEEIKAKNHYRALFSEYSVSKFLNRDIYDACVVISNDSMPVKNINKDEIKDVINNKNMLYTTGFNKWGGLANGFYITSPQIFKLIANRFHKYESWEPNNKSKNPEMFLFESVSENRFIMNKDSDMFYLKIRATGKSNWYIKVIHENNVPMWWYYYLMYS